MNAEMISQETLQLLNNKLLWMPNWKWLAFVSIIVGGFVLRLLLEKLLRKIKARWSQQVAFGSGIHAFLNQPIETPASWMILFVTWSELFSALDLAEKVTRNFDKALYATVIFWALGIVMSAVDSIVPVLTRNTLRSSPTQDQLTPFISKSAKVLIAILGFLLILQTFGVNVMSLLAGLGLGGLALALAAQDTAANLFGSITILTDGPFQVGDWVKVKDIEGHVEEIGFRSTRIRTFHHSLVTIPNSVMAKEVIDNMGERPLRRVKGQVLLSNTTPQALLLSFMERLRISMEATSGIRKNSSTVILNQIQREGFAVLWAVDSEARNGSDEQRQQQDLLNEVIRLAEELKISFSQA